MLVLSWLRTEGELTEMAGNPWVRESPTFKRLEPFHSTVCTQTSGSECARPEAYALPCTESTLEQVLVLSRLRTEGKLPEMAVNQWIRESLLF